MPHTTARTHPPLVTEPVQPAFSQRAFRDALGTFATGVTVVTACNAAGLRVGLTVSSFNSVSLAPPLVLWSLANKAHSMPVFQACTHYAIHVLAADQLALANRFAQRDIDRFEGVACTTGITGAPLIAGAVATFECFNRSRYAEGDHVILVGEVRHCHHRAAAPLLYHAGQLHTAHGLTG